MPYEWVDELKKEQNSDRVRFRRYIAWTLVVYVSVVAANALVLVCCFVLTALGIIQIPYVSLSAWAIGSGGLGAGSLIFRTPMKHLWEDGLV